MDGFFSGLSAVNAVLWHDTVLYAVLAVGLLFTVWTKGCQVHALTHGIAVVCGRYDDARDPGALRPFQALAAALSATVGIGNIGGVALAISLGGPGSVFWMWVIGLVGMALKTAEVSLSMLFRDVSEPDRPRGGPMRVAREGLRARGWPRLGEWVGGLFVVTLLTSSITGGNMFQAWNVAEISGHYFGVPRLLVGGVLAVTVGAVILGGIRRIGAVTGTLVPLMCGLYLLAALVALWLHIDAVPATLRSIVTAAFSAHEAEGAFLGGSAGYAMLWGLKRALFSSEAGQGSSPIAHCAARTDEPIREGVVAGLEPFIDTLVVCTLTALVILTSGVWRRSVDGVFVQVPAVVQTAAGCSLAPCVVRLPGGEVGQRISTVVEGEMDTSRGTRMRALGGQVVAVRGDLVDVTWDVLSVAEPQRLARPGVFLSHQGAALTATAFDAAVDGLGKWLITLAVWLFAVSTMISWSYYGEQGVLYAFGPRWVTGYKIAYCVMILVATWPGLVETDAELDTVTTLGTGVMLWANIPILLCFAGVTMRAYADYWGRLGRDSSDPPPAASEPPG